MNVDFDAPDSETTAPGAWVHIRLIEVGDDSGQIHKRITESNNFQNAVSPRDFVGMDEVQHRLASDFALNGRRYVYKSGEVQPIGDEGCDLTEAAQALACADDAVSMAVQVKREIGALWNADKFYRQLFPKNLDGDRVWRGVLVMRAVDEELATLRKSADRRANLACIHLNRVILHLVFQLLAHKGIRFEQDDIAQILSAAKSETQTVFESVMSVMNQDYRNEYLGTLSKNLGKCIAIAERVMAPMNQREGRLPFTMP